MRKLILSVLVVVLALQCPARGKAIPVIFDTDMGNDVDDAIALAMLHRYVDMGKVDLLGIPTTNHSPYALEYIDMVNTWYGHPSVLLGTADPDRGIANEGFIKAVCENHPELKRSRPATMPSVELYRKLLAGSKDHSVVIISVGFSTNLAALLESGPDEYSKLDGPALVGRKVKYVVSMMGLFEWYDAEFNVHGDRPAAQQYLAKWPTDIVISPFELGIKANFPGEHMQKLLPSDDPVVLGYEAFSQMPYDRPTWDVTAVQYAVEGPAMFTVSDKGHALVNDNARTSFVACPCGRHVILSVTPEQASALVQHQLSFFPLP